MKEHNLQVGKEINKMAEATTRKKRKIIRIDEEKCNGCGLCVLTCAEGALQVIDGKARLVSENYCDGLGACIGGCPEDALIIEEREVAGFDEKAVEEHLEKTRKVQSETACACPGHTVVQFIEKKEKAELPCSCPSSTVTSLKKEDKAILAGGAELHLQSTLTHWPVQLRLVPPTASFLKNSELLLVADCVPFAYANFHHDLLKDHPVLVACPKLDDYDAHLEKLTEIIKQAQLSSITVVHMEVPCCSGLVNMARQAIAASGQDINFDDITIGIRGNRL